MTDKKMTEEEKRILNKLQEDKKKLELIKMTQGKKYEELKEDIIRLERK